MYVAGIFRVCPGRLAETQITLFGAAPETDGAARAAAYSGYGSRQQVGSPLAGQRARIRLDGQVIHVITQDGILWRTPPCPISPRPAAQTQGVRLARSPTATSVRVCGASLTAPLNVLGSTGLVVMGDDEEPSCAGNTITGPVTLTSNSSGVEFDHNTVNGLLTITRSTGTVPPPDTGSLVDVGNKVSGPGEHQLAASHAARPDLRGPGLAAGTTANRQVLTAREATRLEREVSRTGGKGIMNHITASGPASARRRRAVGAVSSWPWPRASWQAGAGRGGGRCGAVGGGGPLPGCGAGDQRRDRHRHLWLYRRRAVLDGSGGSEPDHVHPAPRAPWRVGVWRARRAGGGCHRLAAGQSGNGVPGSTPGRAAGSTTGPVRSTAAALEGAAAVTAATAPTSAAGPRWQLPGDQRRAVDGRRPRGSSGRAAGRQRRRPQRRLPPASAGRPVAPLRADAVDRGATGRAGGTVRICLRGAVHQARRPGARAVPDLLAGAARAAAAASRQRWHRLGRRATGLPGRASIQPGVQALGRHRTRRLPPRQIAPASPGSDQDPSAARMPISPGAGHHAMEEPHDR
jgi:hypothetical protein